MPKKWAKETVGQLAKTFEQINRGRWAYVTTEVRAALFHKFVFGPALLSQNYTSEMLLEILEAVESHSQTFED